MSAICIQQRLRPIGNVFIQRSQTFSFLSRFLYVFKVFSF